MNDAIDFYEKADGNHIVRTGYNAEGFYEELFYVNKPERYEGDVDAGIDAYSLARSYPSFVNGSVEAPPEEFTYIPGFRVVKRREIK